MFEEFPAPLGDAIAGLSRFSLYSHDGALAEEYLDALQKIEDFLRNGPILERLPDKKRKETIAYTGEEMFRRIVEAEKRAATKRLISRFLPLHAKVSALRSDFSRALSGGDEALKRAQDAFRQTVLERQDAAEVQLFLTARQQQLTEMRVALETLESLARNGEKILRVVESRGLVSGLS